MPGPSKPCKFCGSLSHWPFQCYLRYVKTGGKFKPRKRIAPRSSGTLAKLNAMKDRWKELNPPDENGGWDCYLHISPNCLRHVTRETLQYEHVQPRWKFPELKYDESNIQASCEPCNKLKGSSELVFWVDEFPHLRRYL